MSKTYKKYIFVTSNNSLSEEAISADSLETLFKSYTKLNDLQRKGIATPFVDILEIPEDFFDYLINSFTIKHGILYIAKSLVVFHNLNAKVLCLSREELKEALLSYEEVLQGLMEKTTQYLADISTQVVTVDKFKTMFLPEKKK